jgi:TetR/AcrR family transcriptional regulator, mexJK operon transcriptional repressor
MALNPVSNQSPPSQSTTSGATAVESMVVLKDGQSWQKRDEILRGARQVFMEDGFSGARMESVARESGVSKGTLYNYFANKEALFAALITAECEKIRSNVFSLDHIKGTPEAVLTQIGIGFIQSVLQSDSMNMFRTVMAESHKFPELGKIFYESGPGPGSISLGKYLRRLATEGVIEVDDEVLAAYQFIGLCEAGMTQRAHLQVVRPTDAQITASVASAVTLFLKGYSKT